MLFFFLKLRSFKNLRIHCLTWLLVWTNWSLQARSSTIFTFLYSVSHFLFILENKMYNVVSVTIFLDVHTLYCQKRWDTAFVRSNTDGEWKLWLAGFFYSFFLINCQFFLSCWKILAQHNNDRGSFIQRIIKDLGRVNIDFASSLLYGKMQVLLFFSLLCVYFIFPTIMW